MISGQTNDWGTWGARNRTDGRSDGDPRRDGVGKPSQTRRGRLPKTRRQGQQQQPHRPTHQQPSRQTHRCRKSYPARWPVTLTAQGGNKKKRNTHASFCRVLSSSLVSSSSSSRNTLPGVLILDPVEGARLLAAGDVRGRLDEHTTPGGSASGREGAFMSNTHTKVFR